MKYFVVRFLSFVKFVFLQFLCQVYFNCLMLLKNLFSSNLKLILGMVSKVQNYSSISIASIPLLSKVKLGIIVGFSKRKA